MNKDAYTASYVCACLSTHCVDVGEAMSSLRSAGEADVHGAAVQDARQTRRPVNYRTLDELRHRCPDSWRRAAAAALDCTWGRTALPARQLT